MNNLDPLVSVVIPAYNREAFIGEAIRSILQQTFRDLELLVVDDGSTDGTRAVAYRAAREDHRFRFIRRERNGGVSCALNTGFQASRGKFIARLDSDDRATRDRIAAQLHAFSEQERLVAMGSHVFQFGGVPEQLVKFPLSDRDIKAHLITAANHISGGSIMVRRSFIDEHKIRFDERLTVAEDYDYIVSIMEHGGVTINIDAPLIDYRVYGENTSNSRAQQFPPSVQRVRKRLLAIWYPTFSEEEIDHVLDMFCHRPPSHAPNLLRTCCVVDRMISAEPVNYGQDFDIVRHCLAKFLQDMAMKYRDCGLYGRSHFETISAFASPLVVMAMGIL
ncbi:glycosyltransferase family 2 protein [Paraburkholderia kururiensis]|uniref:glycosyltransferase family 2 protein n=1 Tax=Paraburkholderia kururiensis TaxID=984307 RepID=UPI000F867D38|nr:glycosyltransferase family A protein [Paraburkholderia kururiensis]